MDRFFFQMWRKISLFKISVYVQKCWPNFYKNKISYFLESLCCLNGRPPDSVVIVTVKLYGLLTVARFAIFLPKALCILSSIVALLSGGFSDCRKREHYRSPGKNTVLTLQLNIWQPEQRASSLAVLAQNYNAGAGSKLDKVSFTPNFYERAKKDTESMLARQSGVVNMKMYKMYFPDKSNSSQKLHSL